MVRDVQPEILDQLPENHPDALANRRDMRRLNTLMGNFRWILAQLTQASLPSGTRVVELAAGDGALGVACFNRLSDARTWAYTGIDLWERPEHWPAPWNWEKSDLRTAHSLDFAEVIIANHILHQFNDADLAALGKRIRHSPARLLILNETARRPLHRWQARATALLGFNYVSRHDALASVAAGFCGQELPTLLGLRPDQWTIDTRSTWLGAYRLLAQRRITGS